MTLGGNKGCYFAEYGCPDRSASLPHTGYIHHDDYAERALNASYVEHNCLSRALPQYRYCGSHVDYPYTSIFLPTGNALMSSCTRFINQSVSVSCKTDLLHIVVAIIYPPSF